MKKLINNNNWDKIYHLITNKQINYDQNILNGNTVAHYAAINNQKNTIEYFLNHDLSILTKSNNDGNTPIHLLALYGYTDTLKKCIDYNDEFIALVNNNGETISNILYDDYELVKLIVTKYPNYNTIIDDVNSENILTKNIIKTNENDTYFKIIKLLIKFQKAGINSYNDSFLCLSIREKKLIVSKLLIDTDYDVNKKDISYFTPFLYAIKDKNYDLVLELIKKGVDINYNGPEGDQNPLIWSILNNDDKMVDVLLENGYQTKTFNRQLETPLHVALSPNCKLLPSTIIKLIAKCDINATNIYHETPLHLLCKYHDWKNYSHAIKKKKLDIFAINKNKKRPIDYLSGNIHDFLDLVLNSYLKYTRYKIYYEGCRKDFESQECKNEIKKYIFQTQRSIPIKTDHKLIKNMITGIYTNHGLFNADTLHNMIYLVQLLKKYDSIGIPFQYFIGDKYINDKLLLANNNLFIYQPEFVISDLVKIYTDYFYEIVPYLILWRSKDQYFIHHNLPFLIKKCLSSPKIRFIFMKLTLITSESSTHANIIIYDKKYNLLERFEPYGNIPYLDNDELNRFIINNVGKCINDKVIFLSPKDLFGNIGFQTISNDSQIEYRKLGDPSGFCLAWTFWYLELRVSNGDIHPSTLLQQAMVNIAQTDDPQGDKKFINFIRRYSAYLDKIKNDFLKQSMVEKHNLYNLSFSQIDLNKILTHLISDFNQIVKERY
jgi:ankyrin repeat protein